MVHSAPKSTCVAYLCWLIGGLFGLHKLYLRRDREALIYVTTLGGCAVSWIGDLFSIPEMVREANADPRWLAVAQAQRAGAERPPFATGAFVQALTVAYVWAQLFRSALPDVDVLGGMVNLSSLHWALPAVVAVAIWNAGNCGPQHGPLLPALLAAYTVYPVRYVLYDEEYWLFGMMLAATLSFDRYSKRWRRLSAVGSPSRRANVRRRLLVAAVCVCLVGAAATNYYHNGTVDDGEGNEIPVHELVGAALRPGWWREAATAAVDMWHELRRAGWAETWRQLVEQLADGAEAEQNAYRVLGLLPTATQSQITATFRRLSKEFHPDKVNRAAMSVAEQRAAQQRFMEITQAYDKLSKIKSKRRHRNRKSAEAEQAHAQAHSIEL